MAYLWAEGDDVASWDLLHGGWDWVFDCESAAGDEADAVSGLYGGDGEFACEIDFRDLGVGDLAGGGLLWI